MPLSHRRVTPKRLSTSVLRAERRSQDGAGPGAAGPLAPAAARLRAARGSVSSLRRGARAPRGRAASLPPSKAFPGPDDTVLQERGGSIGNVLSQDLISTFNNLRLEVLKSRLRSNLCHKLQTWSQHAVPHGVRGPSGSCPLGVASETPSPVASGHRQVPRLLGPPRSRQDAVCPPAASPRGSSPLRGRARGPRRVGPTDGPVL